MNKKVAIYVRVSTLEQAEKGYSIGEQLEKLKAHSQSKNWAIYNEYVDAGYSGSKLDRPSIKKLISDARSGKFDTVLVYKLDRLSRNLQDALYLIKDVFKANNVAFVSMSENLDLTTAAGELNFNMFASFAEFERANIRDRMQLGLIGRAKSGKTMYYSGFPFGYKRGDDRDTMVIDPIAAPVVEWIFDSYLDGVSPRHLRDKLNDDGHVGRGRDWNYTSLKKLLMNPVYIGNTRWKDKIFENTHTPIITKEIFDRVQKEVLVRQELAFKQTGMRAFTSKYMLTGLVKCGYCGSSMAIHLSKTGKNNPAKWSRRYECNLRGKTRNGYYKLQGRCNSPYYYMEVLEASVLKQLSALQDKDKAIDDIYKKNHHISADKSAVQKEIDKINNKIKKLSDLYMNDLMTLEELQEQSKTFKTEISTLEKSITESSEAKTSLEVFKKEIHQADIYSLSYQKQKILLAKLIKKINVTPENVDIYWNL